MLGALLAAGSLADHGSTWWPGLIVGAAAAALGFVAARSLFTRVRARASTPRRAGALPLYAEGAALRRAPALSILFPPLAILVDRRRSRGCCSAAAAAPARSTPACAILR